MLDIGVYVCVPACAFHRLVKQFGVYKASYTVSYSSLCTVSEQRLDFVSRVNVFEFELYFFKQVVVKSYEKVHLLKSLGHHNYIVTFF